MEGRSHSRSHRCKIPLEYIQYRRPASLRYPRYDTPLPSLYLGHLCDVSGLPSLASSIDIVSIAVDSDRLSESGPDNCWSRTPSICAAPLGIVDDLLG